MCGMDPSVQSEIAFSSSDNSLPPRFLIMFFLYLKYCEHSKEKLHVCVPH